MFCYTVLSLGAVYGHYGHVGQQVGQRNPPYKQGNCLWCKITFCPLLLSVHKQCGYDPARPDSTAAQPGWFHGYTRYLSIHLSVCLSVCGIFICMDTYFYLLFKYPSSFNCFCPTNLTIQWQRGTCVVHVCRKIYLIADGKHLNWSR